MSDKVSNLQRLDRELDALSEQTQRLQSVGDVMALLRGGADAQRALAERLETLEQANTHYLQEAAALRQNLEATANGSADTTKLTHERVQAFAQQVSDLKVDLTQRMTDLRGDVRDVLATKLDANTLALRSYLAEQLQLTEGQQQEHLRRLEAAQIQEAKTIKQWIIGLFVLFILSLVLSVFSEFIT